MIYIMGVTLCYLLGKLACSANKGNILLQSRLQTLVLQEINSELRDDAPQKLKAWSLNTCDVIIWQWPDIERQAT